MIKRRLLYVLMNGILATGLYFGFVHGIAGAENLGLFMAWVGILGGFTVAFNQEAKKKTLALGKSMPDWINTPFDIAVGCVLIWFGAWITGIFWMIHIVLILEVHKKKLDNTKEEV